MNISRSPLTFLRRHGLSDESMRPVPRLDLTALLVHIVPLAYPRLPDDNTPRRSGLLPAQGVLRSFDGDPPPDRGATRPWPDGGLEQPTEQTQ